MSRLKSFFEKHRPDELTEEILVAEIEAIEVKADKIEYDHFNSQYHLDAASLLRGDAESLKSVVAHIIAGTAPIPSFEEGKSHGQGSLVFHGGALWQKTGKDSGFSAAPDVTKGWSLIAGTPSPSRQAATSTGVYDMPMGFSKALPSKTAAERADKSEWQDIEKEVDEIAASTGLSERQLKSATSLRMLLVTRTAIHSALKKAFSRRDKTIAELSKRVEELEAGGISYKGVWQRAQAYRKGAMVTEGGSAWIATRATQEGDKPGPSDAWQLAVKAGRDGSNAR